MTGRGVESVIMVVLVFVIPPILIANFGHILILLRRLEAFKIDKSAPVSTRKLVRESVLPTEQYSWRINGLQGEVFMVIFSKMPIRESGFESGRDSRMSRPSVRFLDLDGQWNAFDLLVHDC